MDKMIFLNVSWMSSYSGESGAKGGGKYVAIHGWGHEMLNFKPFAGRMYGTAPTPGYGDINLQNLGAAKDAEFIDGVLVVWVAKSRIVGWYKNARVYRHPQPSPKRSGRSYKGHPIDYRATALAEGCTILNSDNRHFPVPRAQERKHAMGRYIWYADGTANRAFRARVLKYVAADGDISAVLGRGGQPRNVHGGPHQPDQQKKAKVEASAIELASRHFEHLGYFVNSVEGDNAGWDLNATHRRTSAVLKLEVKGLSGTEISIEMTPNEYSMMRKHKGAYRICVGTSCLKKSQRRLAVFSYNDKIGSWVDGDDRPLKLTEVKSARLQRLN